MNEVKELVEELRNKKSRDNRDLLDRSADMIEKLAKELCEKSGCHHKCHDTTDCVVEEEAELLIKGNKTIPKIRPNPNWRENKNRCCCFCGETRSVKYLVDLPNIYGERALTVDACNRCALLLINENKSNNSDFKSNNFDVKSNEELFKQALVEGLNRRFDREIEEAKKIEQIEEMARDICKLGISCEECTMLARKTNQTREQYCKAFEYAKRAYNAGYRKQSEVERLRKTLDEYEETSGLKKAKAEVAREIFEDIDGKMLCFFPSSSFVNAPHTTHYQFLAMLAELKKKYTKESEDEE